jgi:N6-L-threonylcarbamoyladenine synthase
MIILGIETSCDETSAAILKIDRGSFNIASNVVSSQIDIHTVYGGVVPEIAAREHVKNINFVIDDALTKAKIKPKDIDLIAIASGPGLITSLIAGTEAAKTLSYAWGVPIISVNHMYGHIAGNFLEKIKFPALCVLVSGGHSELILLKDYNNFKKIGQTIDDAAGEAFDKVAKMLGLGYPGGPIVSAYAEEFRKSGKTPKVSFPRPMLHSGDYNFSFSGLKTSVLYTVQKMGKLNKKKKEEVCYEFQEAVVEVLTKKAIKAAKEYNIKSIMMAGGVAANRKLRSSLEGAAKELGLSFYVPEFKLCTDNAAMVAIGGYYLNKKTKAKKDNWKNIVADPNWEL